MLGAAIQLMRDLAVETLQLMALAGQLGPFARHLHFHRAHLRRERHFIITQLAALVLEFLTKGEEVVVART